MNIVVIRHGETDMNKEGRLQGCKGENIGLNEHGHTQITVLQKFLDIEPTRIYASPLKRTQETALIINERFHVPIILVPALIERDFGSLSGKRRSEIDPVLMLNDLEGHYDYRPFGGESVEDVRGRILEFLKTLKLESEETIIVVTHRGVIRILYDLYPQDVMPEMILPGTKHVFHITVLPQEN